MGDVIIASHSSATLFAQILKPGEPSYTEKGFCYGVARNPAKGNSICLEVTGVDLAFNLSVLDLLGSTKYYVRAYVGNGIVTQYSQEVEFTTLITPQIFTDSRDGKDYRYEFFGTALWMIDDLRYNTSTGNYTWATALEICPVGWHLPNNGEWGMLNNLLGNEASSYFSSPGYWWSATEYNSSYAYIWDVSSSSLNSYGTKTNTYAVRCVKD
jgi:hypothetical protein